VASIRVVVSDDHPVARSSIRLALEKATDIEVVGEASDVPQTLRLVQELDPDVLLLDMEMSGRTGAEVTRWLRAIGSRVQVLGVSANDDDAYITEMLSIGAAGYLTKDEAYDMIIDAVRGVVQTDGRWISRRIAARFVEQICKKTPDRVGLTEREREVLRLLVSGKTNPGIAQILHISEKTVQKHLSNIFEKLGVTSRVEAAVQAVRLRLA
jgi:DNA-binding NarL/FixJ family response regulator